MLIEPTLSVVIPTFNKAELLSRTLAALALQEVDAPWEIVVVDDGSSDGTGGVLEEARSAYSLNLTVVRPGHNVGRARARNLGIKAARGRWVLFLDDDILVPPGLLQAHLDELMAGAEETGTIGFAVTDPDLIDAPHFYYLDSRGVARLEKGAAPARYFVTQNAAVPRRSLQEVEGFDEDFSAYGFEDMELAFRLENQCGIRFRVLPRPVPLHIHHHSLEEYFAKKVECGRHSLAMLAESHPARLREMRLHWIIDGEQATPGLEIQGFRALLPLLGGMARFLVARWPTSARKEPLAKGLYCALMNLAVLDCFHEGWRESSAE